jgi:23S rRNA pseudouridine1911/1915/1917 synthase
MTSARLEILYEDNHVLAINKPALLPTMGAREGSPSLVLQAKAYLKEKYAKAGNVYLGVVSRLDAVVTGVVIFARTSKAAARLTEQFRTRVVEKTYWAVVEGAPNPPEGKCDDWMLKSERQARMIIVTRQTAGALDARLSYRTLGFADRGRLLEVRLETGRKHQIRAQLSHRGYPIRGDRKYDAQWPFAPGIALHARRLELVHPVRKTPLEITAPLPKYWRQLGIREDFFRCD